MGSESPVDVTYGQHNDRSTFTILEAQTLMHIRHVDPEAGTSILISEKARVLELPSENCVKALVGVNTGEVVHGDFTINDEDDCFLVRLALRLCNIGLEAPNLFDVPSWPTFVHLTTEAASAHSDVLSHL